MKIVHLIDYYQPQVGYQEYFLAMEHANAGHRAFVVTSDRYFPFPDYENTYGSLLNGRYVGPGEKNEGGTRVIRLRSIEIPGSNLIYLYGLKDILNRIRPDLILCHGIYSLTSYFVAKIKSKIGFRLIYDNHAAAFNTDFEKSVARKIYHSFYKKFLFKEIRRNADRIFAIGEAERDFIADDLDLRKKNVPIIRLGVDTGLFKYSQKERERLRLKYNIAGNRTVVIFTGKITPNKDVHIIVKALEKMKQAATLMLIGGGPADYLDRIRKMAVNTEIIHLPFVENSKLPGYYSSSDVAVWPGDSTIAILEAMSCKLPVILPSYFGTDYLDTSRGITRFKRGDPADLFQKIKKLSYNESLKKRHGNNNRSYAEKQLSWKKIASEIPDLIL